MTSSNNTFDLHTRIDHIRPKIEAWWNYEEQEEPCLIASHLYLDSAELPAYRDLIQFWTDVDFMLERQMKIIDHTNYYGLAVPFHYVDYGSSALACFYGSRPKYMDEVTIWADPGYQKIEDVLDTEIDPENGPWKTTLRLLKNSTRLAKNHHMVSLFAFMGMADLLSGLYGTENFLTDLLLKPDLVHRSMNHLKESWINTFFELNNITEQSGNPGTISWPGIWTPGTSFTIQEDTAYMMSPEQFDEFCLPHIHDFVECLEYPFFHLDGIGMIKHVDSLLNISKLKAIQWQPGAGHESIDQWTDLITKILRAGKSVQVYARAKEVESLVNKVGPKGLLVILTDEKKAPIKEVMEKFPSNLIYK